MSVNIHDPLEQQKPQTHIALLNLGFRPFFLLAGIFSVVTMVLWTLIYHGALNLDPGAITPFQWHAHEMLFGYGMAVIAGFLLTAVKNWTGQQTPVGSKLGLMVLFWLCGRVAFAVGGQGIMIGALFNLCFMGAFALSIAEKIFRVRQWRQVGILAVISLLAGGETLFLVGLMQRDQWLVSTALYGAFYLILLLILLMARRVVPFFIERGVGYPVVLRQSRILDIAVILGVVAYAVGNTLSLDHRMVSGAALLLFISQTIRLVNWHTAGIWKKPLLWSLYVSLVFIDMGFLLAALGPWLHVSSYLILHTFAVGGIGIVTLSMMSRVALGHTGRDVHRAPGPVTLSLILLVLAVIARVVLPLFLPAGYGLWIALSQVLWITAFILFLLIYTPILLAPRVDNKEG